MPVHLTNESFVGLYIVAKFFLSKDPKGNEQFITRSLGKLGLLDRQFKGGMNHQELWISQITKEIMPRASSGAFILMPIKKIDPVLVKKIIPGFYNYEKVGGVAIVRPNENPKDYWILSKMTRQIFAKHRAVIVPIEYKEEVSETVPQVIEQVRGSDTQAGETALELSGRGDK